MIFAQPWGGISRSFNTKIWRTNWNKKTSVTRSHHRMKTKQKLVLATHLCPAAARVKMSRQRCNMRHVPRSTFHSVRQCYMLWLHPVSSACSLCLSVALVAMINQTAITDDVVTINITNISNTDQCPRDPELQRADGEFTWDRHQQGALLAAFSYGMLITQVCSKNQSQKQKRYLECSALPAMLYYLVFRARPGA